MKRLSCLRFFILFCALFSIGCQTVINPFEQNKSLGRGVNIIGYDRIWYSPEKARFKVKHFKLIKEAGFDTVRINLHPFRHMDADKDFALNKRWFEVLEWAVSNALENDLNVILDMHEFNSLGDDPEGKKEKFLSFWKQVAPVYKDAPCEVFFEILNEPCRGVTPELWNEYLKEALAIIRKSNPDRTVIIGPAHWNNIDHLDKLVLPLEDKNIIVTIHYYSPFNFTHQGAPWSEHKDKIGIKWHGSDEEKQNIISDFDKAQTWSKKHDRPLLLGEFGVYDKAEMESRTQYLEFVVRTAESYGWSWAYWQFDKDFVLYDIGNDRWNEPVRDALIPLKR